MYFLLTQTHEKIKTKVMIVFFLIFFSFFYTIFSPEFHLVTHLGQLQSEPGHGYTIPNPKKVGTLCKM